MIFHTPDRSLKRIKSCVKRCDSFAKEFGGAEGKSTTARSHGVMT